MSVARLLKRSIVCVSAMAMLIVCAGVTPALAAKPWWQPTVDSAPAILQPGLAKDEIQEVKVGATGGSFTLSGHGLEHAFAWNATHQEVQKGLEAMYGAGNVEVPSGQGDATGSTPYRVIFTGELADRAVERMQDTVSLIGGNKEVTVSEMTQGRSDATLLFTVANMGDVDSTGQVTLAVKLPPNLTVVEITGGGGLLGFTPLECSSETLICTYSGKTPPFEQLQITVEVNLKPGAKSGETSEIAVAGGNALPAKASRAITVGDTPPAFGVESYEMTPEEEGGTIDSQAGSHPFQLTTKLMLNQRDFVNPFGTQYVPNPIALGKDLSFRLPPGLIGNPTPFPQCTLPRFLNGATFINECPNNTAIGVVAVSIRVIGAFPYTTVTVPLFNLTPSVGEPARFGFMALSVPVYLDTAVRTGGDYGVTVKVSNITQTALFVASRVTFWGVPGDARHDTARGWSCVSDEIWKPFFGGGPCVAAAQHRPPPFLELPTSCTGPLQTTVEADSWAQARSFQSAGPTVPLPSLDGCNALPFSPSISVSPDGNAGSTPTGLTVGVHVPQEVSLDAEGLGEADVKDTTVTLPAGVSLNPAAADGLSSCSEAQIALEVHNAATCPDASKVATAEIKSPLLPNALTGEVYLAAQNANPFGSLLALYIVVQDPVSGTLVKVAGEVKPDPVTGQLVSTFKNTPQLPFEDLNLHFFGGSRAPLASPALCGGYTTSASIASWSGNPASESSSEFPVLTGPNGSACFNPLPFAPALTGGTTSIQAGGLSPFTMTMSREDGNQNLQAISLHMPPGLSGLLSGVKLCGEAQADAGTCGSDSEIGETIVSVGVGGSPFSVRGGKVFVTEGYEGAPYGLSIVNPAKAGPFDLGQVVVRARIEVDPITAALTITSDNSGPYKIPSILDGIPLHIQHVNVTINRPGFTFNPTNCNPMSITGSLTSTEGATSALSVPFQVTNCAVLGFKPAFSVSTQGKTSRAGGASLHVKLVYPKAPFGSQANIGKVKVDLPKQLPSRLSTLQKACTDSVFNRNPASCPPESRIGLAKATTPLLPVPLSGPVYFVSHGGAKFPELVIVLSGYGTTVQLHAETFISKTGVTSSTFRTVPDVPVGTFELTLPQGKFSALAAPRNLCGSKLRMPTVFTAQNGAQIKQSTPIAVTGCGKAKKKKGNEVAHGKHNGHGRK
jgi:hypothetical protein